MREKFTKTKGWQNISVPSDLPSMFSNCTLLLLAVKIIYNYTTQPTKDLNKTCYKQVSNLNTKKFLFLCNIVRDDINVVHKS